MGAGTGSWARGARPAPAGRRVRRGADVRYTVAKLALGIEDNQALTTINEAIGALGLSVVEFPRVNAAHARHPAWDGHLAALRRTGVHLGLRGRRLAAPRAALGPDRDLPWGGNPGRRPPCHHAGDPDVTVRRDRARTDCPGRSA
jgi:hypothetical protein